MRGGLTNCSPLQHVDSDHKIMLSNINEGDAVWRKGVQRGVEKEARRGAADEAGWRHGGGAALHGERGRTLRGGVVRKGMATPVMESGAREKKSWQCSGEGSGGGRRGSKKSKDLSNSSNSWQLTET